MLEECIEEARRRAQYWLQRLERIGDPELESRIHFMRRASEDPCAASFEPLPLGLSETEFRFLEWLANLAALWFSLQQTRRPEQIQALLKRVKERLAGMVLCREAGLPAPEFRQDGGQFVQTLWRPKREVTEEVTEEVTRLVRAVKGEMKRAELQAALKLRHENHFRWVYLLPALAAGLVERTIPDKPNSRLQKYRLTAKGRAWRARLKPKAQ